MPVYTNELLHSDDELLHYRISIKDGGMPNGKRQYQYPDGSLTPLGREHYGVGPAREPGSAYDKLAKKAVKVDEKLQKHEKRLEGYQRRSGVKAANYQARADKLRSKKFGLFVSKDKAADLEYRAQKLEAKSNRLMSGAEKEQAKIDRLNTVISKYNRKLENMDSEKVKLGESIVEELKKRK